MKKLYYYLGLVAITAALAACDSDNEPAAQQGDKAIKFSAVVPERSRAASTTTATIKDFVVYAFTENATLMDGVKVTRNGGSWTYSPEAYWPVSPVNFYAFSPDISSSPNIQGTAGGNIPDYLNDGMVDLLYSVRSGVMQQAAPVEMNFRHAMSNVKVLLSSSNQRIAVKVSHITINNIYIQGTFDFPTMSTLASTPEVTGSWSMLKNLNNMLLFYAISADEDAVLTPVPTDYAVNNLEHSFTIPQQLADVSLSEEGYAGTYISVECAIYDTATNAKLWPNTHTPDYMLVPHTEVGRIVYPATSDVVKEWLPGHEYVYNITINNPDVLDKIEFDVTVDDYVIDRM